jgi:hypothetical protein
MSRSLIAKYVTPWKFRREQKERRLNALRERDGDNCRRCRRPIRFDLPKGHDKGPTIEPIGASANGDAEELDNFCLCHVRCNAPGADNTAEVTERIRRQNEAALLSNSRKRA